MVVKHILSAIALSACMLGRTQKEITSVFPLKWKTPIGITTYRTNIVEHEGLIYIGSNGENRTNRMDPQDGVYAIDPKSGKIVRQYTMQFGGDNDVTGIAIGDGKLFFGTDNYYFFCFDLKSHRELWKYHLPYDVESCPVLDDFNGDKILDASFSVQGHGFYALNGVDGKLIWLNEAFTSNEGNVSPLAIDLNGDGVKDIVNSGFGITNVEWIAGEEIEIMDNYHFALDGKTGEMLWKLPSGSDAHSSPSLSRAGNSIEICLIDNNGSLQICDRYGKLLRSAEFIFSAPTSPLFTNDQHLIVGERSYDFSIQNFNRDHDTLPYYLNRMIVKPAEYCGSISATSMIADVLGKGKPQILSVAETGQLFISETDGTLIQELKIPGGAEASLFINDIDGDGKLEIILASLDGNLYCYETNSKGKVEQGKFR